MQVNPTNPADRATDWQADIIATFRQDAAMSELVSERDTPIGRMLHLSRPFRLTDKACLTCHSIPAAAPASMTSLYGRENGFGWKLGEVIGAQVVSIPMQVPSGKATQIFALILGGLCVVFGVMLLLLNVLLHFLIVKPVRAISRAANEISLGNMRVGEYKPKGKHEIAALATSFNRLRRSVVGAMAIVEAERQLSRQSEIYPVPNSSSIDQRRELEGSRTIF